MAQKNVVVVGAGVSGLTSALLLAKKGYNVSVVAKDMPGDYDIEYASPWAGADYRPFAPNGSKDVQFEKATFKELWRLATELPEAGIEVRESIVYNRDRDRKDKSSSVSSAKNPWEHRDPWFKDVLPEFRGIPSKDLPDGYDTGFQFRAVCINTALYLPYLASQCLKHGVTLNRAIVSNLKDAIHLHRSGQPASLIINCTGLLASRAGGLGPDGLGDKTVYPGRGQTVLVRNETAAILATSGTDDGPDEKCYIIPRAAGGGTILGGCFQKGNWESQPDINLASRIMARAVGMCPELGNGRGVLGLDVVRLGVGLRPVREDGVRVGASWVDGVLVVHNYGHAGYGYQMSYGCAEEVVSIVDEVLQDSSNVPQERMVAMIEDHT